MADGVDEWTSFWLVRLLLNLAGYATVILPGFLFIRYIRNSGYLNKPGDLWICWCSFIPVRTSKTASVNVYTVHLLYTQITACGCCFSFSLAYHLYSVQKRVYGMLHVYTGWAKKTGPFLIDDNFAAVSGRKVSDMSKVCKFCLEKCIKLACLCV